MCLYVAIYLSLMGEKGLHEVNALSADGAHALFEALTQLPSFEPAFPGQPFLNEFTLRYKGQQPLPALLDALADEGFLGGVVAEGADDLLIVSVTEQRTKADVEAFVAAMKKLA